LKIYLTSLVAGECDAGLAWNSLYQHTTYLWWITVSEDSSCNLYSKQHSSCGWPIN